ncbi:protein NUCLEAR FUSION DEFECTIVE 4 isoform X3 [Morus notabilis]|uniref:protein NUCLEAR FUSION DEFECTIVE 4 isoform X3 n=1 Tax=Morus notabilis TaxID=981085 RepID=UPI000CED2BA0|nr:protein NUCLEAR FUSION DEFECTIVE 4 isoform X3 [Morus notabilis]
MTGQSTKWMIVAAAIWIQAFTGTNLDFSSYSSHLKSVLEISQVQLNYLSVASDLGKALGWCSGVSLLYLPLWTVMFIAALVGFFGYGLQWLVLQRLISLPYALVFLLCLLAGWSICWFNTVCFVLCIKNFSTNRALALSLTLSFNGLSGALYTLVANAINPKSDTLYLFLNAMVPLIISSVAIIPVIREPPLKPLPAKVTRCESLVFLCLYILAAITGLYLLFLNFLSTNAPRARFLLVGAIFLLTLPFCLPGIPYARHLARRNIHFSSSSNNLSFHMDDNNEPELYEELIERDDSMLDDVTDIMFGVVAKEDCLGKVIEKDTAAMMLGEEHPARLLVRSSDFWLYYITYFCGGTIGLVYSNNLGQISQSLGYASQTSSLVTLYSSCSFFGRLLSAAPDFLRDKNV